MCYTSVMSDQFERIVAIETKLAYVEDSVERLHAIIIEHSNEIDRLKAENIAFRAKVGEIQDSILEIPDQRPPHY